ncbi:MAG: CidA/LrgA family protein [Christensenellales bacterium]|jgi:holin-like protein
MKWVFQLGVIFVVSFAGEMLRIVIPLPIPASIYGLILMLLCLKTKIVKLKHVQGAGAFLLEVMPLLFVPATVGLMVTWDALSNMLLPFLAIMVLNTLIVLVVTGRTAQLIMRKDKDK